MKLSVEQIPHENEEEVIIRCHDTQEKWVEAIRAVTAGEVYIDGKSIRTQPLECKRSFAYIPDNPDLYDFLTGIKYLNFIADIFGVSVAERQTRIRKCGDFFELPDDLAQPIAAYSHGMKQKLAIISAWLHQPKLIFMDEPFVGLDPKASHLLKGMMWEVCDEGGVIFFSTHVLEVAEKLCDKVAIIKRGKLASVFCSCHSRWIYAPARMDIGILRVYELFCGGKSVSVCVGLSVAEKKGGCPFFVAVRVKR